MLCLKCINTEGELARQIGEVIIPFDVDKITRDCKYFERNTIVVALELFKRLGMIYQEENGCLKIAEFENMVGSETDWAAQKRNQVKSKENILIESGDNVETSVEKFHTENRYKILDIDTTLSLPQKNYAEQIFNIWKEHQLPRSKTLIDFTMNEFRNALQYIKGIHSDSVIKACNNYISVLLDNNCYVTNKYWFDSFVQCKNFRDYLPDNFDISKFKKYENQNNYQSQKEETVKKQLQDKKDYWLEEN